MKAVIDHALGNVFLGDATLFLDRADVDDALVCDVAAGTGIQHRVVVLQAMRNVVGVKYCHFGRLGQARAAHERDISPGDRQDGGTAVGRARDHIVLGAQARYWRHRVGGQEWL